MQPDDGGAGRVVGGVVPGEVGHRPGILDQLQLTSLVASIPANYTESKVGAYALSESGSGSDAFGLAARAEQKGDADRAAFCFDPRTIDWKASAKRRRPISRHVAGAMPPEWRADSENILALLGRIGGRWVRGQLLLGGDFARLRPPRPGFTILGGMMVNRDEAALLP